MIQHLAHFSHRFHIFTVTSELYYLLLTYNWHQHPNLQMLLWSYCDLSPPQWTEGKQIRFWAECSGSVPLLLLGGWSQRHRIFICILTSYSLICISSLYFLFPFLFMYIFKYLFIFCINSLFFSLYCCYGRSGERPISIRECNALDRVHCMHDMNCCYVLVSYIVLDFVSISWHLFSPYYPSLSFSLIDEYISRCFVCNRYAWRYEEIQ